MRKTRQEQIIIGLILAVCVFCCRPVYAQGQAEVKQDEIKRLEEVARLLKDEKQTRQLIDRIDAIIEAKKTVSKQKAAESEKPKAGFNIILAVSRYRELLSVKIKVFWEKLKAIVTDYQKLAAYFSVRENLYRLLDIGFKLLLACGAGLLILLLLKRSTKRWSARLIPGEVINYSQKIKSAGLGLLLNIYPTLVLSVAGVVFLWLVFPGKALMLTMVLVALVVYRIILGAIYHLLSPEDISRRLTGFNDEIANYIYIWSRRISLFSLWLYWGYILSSGYGLSQSAFVLTVVYKIGIVVMLVLILAQMKEEIAAKFTLTLQDTDRALYIGLKRTLNVLMGNLYLFVLVYSSIIVILSLLGAERLWRYLLYSSLKTLLIIVIAGGVWRLWDMAFQRLFEVSANIRQRLPGLEEQVNRYVMVIGRLGHLLILGMGFLLVLEMWQVDVFLLLSQYKYYFFRLVRIPVILGIAVIAVQLSKLLIKKFEQKIIARRKYRENIPDMEIEKQVTTIVGLLRKSVFIAIWVITVLMVVRELGFDIAPALAGAGIVGVALGFGTQNLVRDIISGLFMIAENQVRVGDVAILNGTGGLVEAINLRTTVLRGLDGTVHVFPNGTVSTLSNMTREFSYYLFEVGVAYKEDVDRVIEVLKSLSDEIMRDKEFRPNILEPLEILGLDKFADSAVIIKARIKTLPIKQWLIGREMNRRIKKRFDELGIEIPFPHRTFYFGEVSPPIKIKTK